MDGFQDIFHSHFNIPIQNPVLVFSFFLLIIFLAPLLFRRLKMPGIVGLIISGLIFGPHGINLLEQNNAVELFSTIGLLYLMFLAGLELDMNRFIKSRNKSFVFGFLTLIIPLFISFPVCYYLLGYSFNASILTASLLSAHTLISFPIVSRFKITNNEVISITVGGTILADTAVLIILAFVAGSYESAANHFLFRFLISLIIFLLIVFILVPKLTRFIFSKPDIEKHMHFIFVLLVVFLSAYIAKLAGLEPIIGAFAAGLSINKLIPRNSALRNRLEFIGNSIFIPIFLISVGMLINLKGLSNELDAWVVTIVMLIIAHLAKWLASYFTSTIFKFSKAQRDVIFGLSIAHAASALAVALVGFRLGIIDDNILNGTILLILVTCLVGSFVTEKAARKIMLEDAIILKADQSEITQKILVPIANPDKMGALVDFALIINNHQHKPPIIGVSVVDDDEKAPEKILQARKMLEEAIHHASASDQPIEIITTIDRNIPAGISRISKELFVTEIVLGWSQKNSLSDIIFGRIVDEIIELSKRTVFILRILKPLNVYSEIKVFCPPFSEADSGFNKWLDRVFRLSTTLSKKITFYSTYETYVQIELFALKYNIVAPINHNPFQGWYEMADMKLDSNDLGIVISPRRKSIAFHPEVRNIIRKSTRKDTVPGMIIIYPEI